MIQGKNTHEIPVAHNGDWYYYVGENDIEYAEAYARETLTRRTRIGRALAARNLSKLVERHIDLLVDDTELGYNPAHPLAMAELAREVLIVVDRPSAQETDAGLHQRHYGVSLKADC